MLVAALACVAPLAPARAQTGLIRLEDASMPPSGVVRFRATNEWIRWDQRFSADGKLSPLVAGFAAESLGSAQLGGLTLLDNALRALTGDATSRVSLGRLDAAGDSRVVVTPLSLEYGLSNRLSFGVLVPVVQARTTIRTQLNGDTNAVKNANVGVNPQDYTASATVAQDFSQAAASLAQRIQQCQGSVDPGCAAINADPTGAAALEQAVARFGAAVTVLYGTGVDAPGSPVVPMAGSNTLTAINQNIATLNQSYQQYMGSAITAGALGGAAVQGANRLLGQVLKDPSLAGVDSVGARELLWVGDIEVSTALQLVNQLADSARPVGGLRWRSAVQAVVRLPTGRVARGRTLYEIGSGTGQLAVEGRLANDLRFGRRFGTTIVGQYVASLGSARVFGATSAYGGAVPLGPRAPMERELGSVLQVDVAPRFTLARYFTLDGYYSLIHRADDRYTSVSPSTVDDQALVPGFQVNSFVIPGATEQRVGFGFGYSTLGDYTGGRAPLPIEVSFSHLETLHASGGPVYKASFDQVRFRLYLRVFGR